MPAPSETHLPLAVSWGAFQKFAFDSEGPPVIVAYNLELFLYIVL